MGRPSSFTQEIADQICERLAGGETLRTICEDSELAPDYSTVFRWLAVNESFRDQYARAKEVQGERMADEILSIADSATSEDYNAARLQVDSRKWLLSKMIPKKYGDATLLKHADPDGNVLKVQVEEIKGSTE